MLICFGVLSFLQAQNPKISVDRTQLVELTKQAEKTALLESENRALLIENDRLKNTNESLNDRFSNAEKQVESFKRERNNLRLFCGVLILAIAVSVILRVKKYFS